MAEDHLHLREAPAASATTKNPASPDRPGERSPAWLKLKPKLTLEVVVTGGTAKRIAWGDWSEAVMLELAYEHARTGEPKHIRQVVRIAPISRSSSRLANAPS